MHIRAPSEYCFACGSLTRFHLRVVFETPTTVSPPNTILETKSSSRISNKNIPKVEINVPRHKDSLMHPHPPSHHPRTFFLGTSFDASFGYRLAIVWLLSGPEREETMGKRLPNDMPNEQWGRGGVEMKGRWELALCPAHFSRS